MTAGLVRYLPGRRDPAGRKRSAGYALAPDAMRRAVRWITGGMLAAAALATLPAVVGRLTTDRLVDLPALVPVVAVAAGLILIALAPWPRRTMHPVHRGSGRGDWWQNR
ncbi:hypothetical protein [Streptomyces yangpuensis]|uniref:hypothetical protein n=1 Tax=Streptomyces yangpuensis TaxID=1648182 RepID=UPI00364ABFB0